LIRSEKIRERGAALTSRRPGNVHGADDWEDMLLPEVEWQQKLDN
jgi:hypothetical protein